MGVWQMRIILTIPASLSGCFDRSPSREPRPVAVRVVREPPVANSPACSFFFLRAPEMIEAIQGAGQSRN